MITNIMISYPWYSYSSLYSKRPRLCCWFFTSSYLLVQTHCRCLAAGGSPGNPHAAATVLPRRRPLVADGRESIMDKKACPKLRGECRGLNTCEYQGAIFLVWLEHQVPQRDLNMILVISQAAILGTAPLHKNQVVYRG